MDRLFVNSIVAALIVWVYLKVQDDQSRKDSLTRLFKSQNAEIVAMQSVIICLLVYNILKLSPKYPQAAAGVVAMAYFIFRAYFTR